MIFRCYLCKNYCFWSKNNYIIKIVGNNQSLDKRICESCGDGINEVYDHNETIMDMEQYNEE